MCKRQQQLFHQPVLLNVVAIVAVMMHLWLVLLERVNSALLPGRCPLWLLSLLCRCSRPVFSESVRPPLWSPPEEPCSRSYYLKGTVQQRRWTDIHKVCRRRLCHGPLTCEHGTEVGTAGRQDHPVGWYLNASCHQLDVTQYLFAETWGETKRWSHIDPHLGEFPVVSQHVMRIDGHKNAPPQVIHQLESLPHVRMVESGHPSIHGVLLGIRGAVGMWHGRWGHQAGKTGEAMSGWGMGGDTAQLPYLFRWKGQQMQMWRHIIIALIQFGGLHFERIVAVPSDSDLHSFTLPKSNCTFAQSFLNNYEWVGR